MKYLIFMFSLVFLISSAKSEETFEVKKVLQEYSQPVKGKDRTLIDAEIYYGDLLTFKEMQSEENLQKFSFLHDFTSKETKAFFKDELKNQAQHMKFKKKNAIDSFLSVDWLYFVDKPFEKVVKNDEVSYIYKLNKFKVYLVFKLIDKKYKIVERILGGVGTLDQYRKMDFELNVLMSYCTGYLGYKEGVSFGFIFDNYKEMLKTHFNSNPIVKHQMLKAIVLLPKLREFLFCIKSGEDLVFDKTIVELKMYYEKHKAALK